jgi:cyclase
VTVSEGLSYARGLQDLGGGCHAWLEPPGSWGLANSGIVVGKGESLVIDTQNDVPMASALRTAVDTVAGQSEVSTVVNTHADGDHWNGNMLFDDARIIASAKTLEEMHDRRLDPAHLSGLIKGDSVFDRFIKWRTEVFDYTEWRPVLPTETFTDKKTIVVGNVEATLIQVGPAHTTGDTIVHIPSAGVVFAGDVLFTGSTPIAWTGPLSRCIAACDLILALEAQTVVPGHGPVTNSSGVRHVRDYFEFVADYATRQFDAGKTPNEAYAEIDLGPYASLPHASRVYQNIRVVYNERDPQRFPSTHRETLEVVLSNDPGPWSLSIHAHD